MTLSRALMERDRTIALRQSERLRGVPTSMIRFTASRVADSQVPVVFRLPCTFQSASAVQDEDGNFLFDPDYSHADGPDIV